MGSKNDTNELIHETNAGAQRTDFWLLRANGVGEEGLGVRDQQMQTVM